MNESLVETEIRTPRRTQQAGPLLNLGCGKRLHPAWVNVDLHPQAAGVLAHDVRGRLPFVDDYFEAVYLSHLLEHLSPEDALGLACECRRILRPGGILRVVVPDLEQIVQMYLETVDAAWLQKIGAGQRHAWMTLELLDQLVRGREGGRMLTFLRESPTGRAFALQRLGADGRELLQRAGEVSDAADQGVWSRWRTRLRGWLFGSWRERLIRRVLGREYALLQSARFRMSGEPHGWMYDRVSLRALLEKAGFVDIDLTGPSESAIRGWHEYHLDTLSDGSQAKPDSLYVEARK